MKKKYQFLRILTIVCTLLGAVSLIITIYLLNIDNKIHFFTSIDLDEASKIGDFVGGFVGIFWTIAGILLLFITLRVQSDEFKATQEAIIKQQFETTFFNMLLVLSTIRDHIVFIDEKDEKDKKHYKSYDFFELLKSDLENHYQMMKNKKSNVLEIEDRLKKLVPISALDFQLFKDFIITTFIEIHKKYHFQISHYFRYLSNLISFTIENRSLFKDEQVYIDLIQAQLSENELRLIFYYSLSHKKLSNNRDDKLFSQVSEYNFLKQMDSESLIDRSHHFLFSQVNFNFLNRDELKTKKQKLYLT